MREQHSFPKEQPDSQPASQGSGEKPNNTIASGLEHFRNYDLVRRIGIGGMGEVYLARQRTAFGREVAVKIIRPDLIHDITVRKRFLNEAKVSAYLQNDHILPFVEFGEENGRLFLVTYYSKGGTLSKRLRSGEISLPETHQLFTALVEAVAYLHKRGVIHRDLKPSNILLEHEEDNRRVYVRLIDFGIASIPGQLASPPLTTAGNEMGTEAYMAPERFNGIAAPSNDIYSLGIILYQMLTGQLPQDDMDSMLPDPLLEVVQQCTAEDLNKRYASAEELLKAFERAYQSLSLSHFRSSLSVHPTGSNPAHPPLGQNASAHMPSVRLQQQASLSAPIAPMSHGQARAVPHTPGVPNVLPITNPTILQNLPRSSTLSGIDADPAQIRLEHTSVLEPKSYPSQPSLPVRLRSEVVLPPLPDKTSTFKGEDYNAPTSYLAPKPLQKIGTISDHTARTGQERKVLPRPNQKKRGTPIITIISVIIIVIFFVIGGLGYAIYQSFDTATVTIMPQAQPVSTVFNLTAKLNQTNVDSNAGIIPANMLTSTKSASQSGNTTGQDVSLGCFLNPQNCKHTVTEDDVHTLVTQIKANLQSQIAQDIHQQEQAQGATPVSNNIFYGNETDTVTPQVGAVSNTVTVAVSLQGSQEYIKASDAQTVAKQKLLGQLKPNYSLIDSTVKTSQPVVQGRADTQGNVQIKIAAGGVSRYTFLPNDISTIKNNIRGKSRDQARTFIANYPNLDPKTLNINVSYGGNLPGNVDQITVNSVDPSPIPFVQLPLVT